MKFCAFVLPGDMCTSICGDGLVVAGEARTKTVDFQDFSQRSRAIRRCYQKIQKCQVQ